MNSIKKSFAYVFSMCTYGNVGKNFYKDQQTLLDKSNLHMVKFALGAETFLFSMLVIASFIVESMSKFTISYLISAVLALATFILSRRLNVENHKLIRVVYIIASAILGFSLIYIGVFVEPNVQAVSFFFSVFIVPVLYLDKPMNSLLLVFIQNVVFIGIDIVCKWDYPNALELDILNSICCFATASVFTVYIRNMHLSSMQMSISYQYKSEIDKLTGINNKASSEALCHSYINTLSTKSMCAMMILDVDNFKTINDSLGHSQGDVILNRVGTLLKSVFRESDIVGRIGGDEFLVLMKNINNSVVAELKADEIVRKFPTIFPEAVNAKLSCSIGVSVNINAKKDYDEMFIEADKALYISKNNGKSGFTVFSEKKIIIDDNKPLMLIADDDAISRAVLENCFKDKFNIITADNGAKALGYLKMYPGRISIVLLDVVMPVMNGYDVLKIMKKSNSLSRIPVIAISADKGNELMTLDMGATDYIEKPINSSVARKRIQIALSRNR